jgi:hypothetical protein
VNEETVKTFTPDEIKKMADDIFKKNKVVLPSIEAMEDVVTEIPITDGEEIIVAKLPEKQKRGKKKEEPKKVLVADQYGNMGLGNVEPEEDSAF